MDKDCCIVSDCGQASVRVDEDLRLEGME